MKTVKIIYWISTGLISLMMLFSAYMYFTSPDVAAGFVHLGFPSYFRIELGTLKLLGALALAIPFIPGRVKEWAYFGFFINFVSAAIAHLVLGDPIAFVLVTLVILLISYFSYHKLLAETKHN